MIDESKVKIMTRMAIYEKKSGKKEMPVAAFYKKDYARYYALKSMILALIGYILIMVLIFLANVEQIIANFAKYDYRHILFLFGGACLAFLFLYYTISYIYYLKKYDKIKEHIDEYRADLEKLNEIYIENDKEMNRYDLDERSVTEPNDEFIDY